MAKITKLPSGKYNIRIYDKRLKTTKSFTSSSKDELKRIAAEYQFALDMADNGDCTIKQAIESYINNRTAVASPSTIRGYRQLQRNYYKTIEDYSVSAIKSEDIQKLVNDISKNHSPKTVRNIYGLLISSILAFNPDKRINVTLPQKEAIQRHIPTDNDIKILLDNSKGELRIAILLAAIGTMRRGEICALNYEDIKGNVIHIHADMVQGNNREWIIKSIPKTSSSDRYIEYPQEVIDEIGTGKGRILLINPNSLTQAFKRLRDSLGIECRFHDLRHYAASIMHAIGIPDQYIMERGGWSSDSILKSVYRNILNDKKNEFTDMTNNYMSKLL